jgi:lipid-binding SYLF domain-containing protein
MINMKAVFALALMLAPMVGHAELSFDSLKEGAAKAAKAVGETTADLVNSAGEATGKAADAVTDTVDSSNEALRDEATPEETRAKLDAMAKATLARLFEEEPATRELFDRSAGYAVFDKREASFYIVAGYGRGVAVDTKTGEHVYMKMATTGAGVGFGLGGFASQLVILFENDAAFQNFVVNGLDAGAEVGAMTGDEKERLALGFDEGKAVFVLTGKGWKVSAKLTGSRYWPDEALNDR